MSLTLPSRLASLFGAALLALALCLHFWDARAVESQADDAYISYRYAVNLAQGHGLVFNVGERVEGITNLLWTLLLALAEVLGVASPLTAHVLGAASGAFTLVLTFLLCRAQVRNEHAWLAGLAALAVWTSSSFWVWVLSGLETPLFAMLVLAAFYAQSKNRQGWVSVAITLATLTRPEGVLLAAAIYGAQLWQWRNNPRAIFEAPARWLPVVFYAVSLVALTLFRLAYYGMPVPNTFYAKVGGIPLTRGVAYVAGFFRDGVVWLVPAIAVAVWSRYKKWPASDSAPAHLAAPTVFVLLFFAYVIYVGGDVFGHSRFLLPVLPLLMVMACAGISAALSKQAERSKQTTPAWLLVAGLVAATVWPLVATPVTRESLKTRNWVPDDYVRSQAAQLKQMQPPVQLVASVSIGRLGYFSGLPVLDLVGLVDAHIARAPISASLLNGQGLLLPGHQRSDPQYVLDRRPDIIVIPQKAPEPGFNLPVTLDLWAQPRFEAEYVWNANFNVYERRDRINQ
jgi:arabinofuranosyltransferase